MFTARRILEWLGMGRVANAEACGADLDRVSVDAMSTLTGSGPSHLCFFFNKEYQSELPGARPGILVTGEPFITPLEKAGLPLWKSTLVISAPDPYWAMARLSALFAGATETGKLAATHVHPSAVVDPSARIATGVSVGANCVIEAGASIGEGTRLHPGCVIGAGVVIGSQGEIFPNVTIYPGTRIGTHVRVHSGTVIGSDGFGYAPVKQGSQVVGHEKIHHLGGVKIGNHVEIGANSCVDRGTLGDTIIEDHVKADNLVQIAHNAVAREGAILCGCSGLAGGSVLGRFAYLGGQACVVNKATVGDGALVGAASLITKDVGSGEQVAGSPQRPLKEHLKVNAYLNRMIEKKGGSS